MKKSPAAKEKSCSEGNTYHGRAKKSSSEKFGSEGKVCVMVLHGGTVPGGTACEGTAGGGTVGQHSR